MAPVAVVVAYFGTQQPIFHFDRNLKSFSVCVAVLVIALKVYTFLIVLARQLGLQERLITWFMASKHKRIERTVHADGKSPGF